MALPGPMVEGPELNGIPIPEEEELAIPLVALEELGPTCARALLLLEADATKAGCKGVC